MNALRLTLAIAIATTSLGGCSKALSGGGYKGATARTTETMMIVSPADTKASSFLVCRAEIEDAGRAWARARGYRFALVEKTKRYLQYRIDGDSPPTGGVSEARSRFTLMVIYDDYNKAKWWKRPEPRLELECSGCAPAGPQPAELSQLEDHLRDAVDCR